MDYIFFTFLCFLGPEISTARKYLIIDLDALEKLELSSHVTRRQSENVINVEQPKDLLEKVINTLQSYDKDQLNDVINSFENELKDLNINDVTLNEAKDYVLGELYQAKDEPGKLIRDIMNVASQILDDDSYENTGRSERARDDYQKIGRILDLFTLRNNKNDPFANVIDAIKSVLQSVAELLLKSKEQSDGNGILDKLKNELRKKKGSGGKTDWKKDTINKLKDKVKNLGQSENKNTGKSSKDNMLNKLASQLHKKTAEGGGTTDWKKDLLSKLTHKHLQKRLNTTKINTGRANTSGDKTDWKDLLTKFVKDTKEHDWMGILKKIAGNQKALDFLGKYAKDLKPAGHYHGVHLSL